MKAGEKRYDTQLAVGSNCLINLTHYIRRLLGLHFIWICSKVFFPSGPIWDHYIQYFKIIRICTFLNLGTLFSCGDGISILCITDDSMTVVVYHWPSFKQRCFFLHASTIVLLSLILTQVFWMQSDSCAAVYYTITFLKCDNQYHAVKTYSGCMET